MEYLEAEAQSFRFPLMFEAEASDAQRLARRITAIQESLTEAHDYAELLGIDWQHSSIDGFQLRGLATYGSPGPRNVDVQFWVVSGSKWLWVRCSAYNGAAGMLLNDPISHVTTLGETEWRRLHEWMPGENRYEDGYLSDLIVRHKLRKPLLESLGLLRYQEWVEVRLGLLIRLPQAFRSDQIDEIEAKYDDCGQRWVTLSENGLQSLTFIGKIPVLTPPPIELVTAILVSLPSDVQSQCDPERFTASVDEELARPRHNTRVFQHCDGERRYRSEAREVYEFCRSPTAGHLVRITLTDGIVTASSVIDMPTGAAGNSMSSPSE